MFDPPKWAAPFLAAIFNGEGFNKRGCPFETAPLKSYSSAVLSNLYRNRHPGLVPLDDQAILIVEAQRQLFYGRV